MLHVDPMDPRSPVAMELIAQLTCELADRYPEEARNHDANFKPIDPTNPRSIFLVAWFGSDPVGCGALRPMAGATTSDMAEIKHMFVAPAARGKGIGGEILRELEAHARGFGYSRLVLETGIRQPEAVALYEREGYKAVAKFAPYENNPLSLCFEKRLPPIA